jgi:transcriptional regulator with XRE-family HTH domain
VNFGEKVKQLRTEKSLTQPQLAQAIGIEQSYLSKLENDKSVPSADIFQAILKAFAIDVRTFLEGIDEQIIQRELRQIPEVASLLNANAAFRIHNIKKWLFASALAGVLGLSLIAAGYKGLIFSGQQYSYSSPGVVLPGEPSNIFDRFEEILRLKAWAGELTDKEKEKRTAEFKMRVQEQVLTLDAFRGMAFNEPVEGGTRVYTFRGQSNYERAENRYLMLAGTLLTFLGIFGFFVEFRLRDARPS